MDYDQAYSDSPAHFGDAPDPALVRCDHLLDPSRPVLDVGCGQGRNSVYLARRGITVHAFDTSRVAIEQLKVVIAREKLPIFAVCGSFEELRPKRTDYGGVLLFGLLQEVPWSSAGRLLRFCRDHLGHGGLFWITCFTTDDPAFRAHAEEWQTIGHNSFQGPSGEVRTYLERGQLVTLLPGFEVVHHWEGLGPEHRHGDGSPERHGRAEVVLRKP